MDVNKELKFGGGGVVIRLGGSGWGGGSGWM